MVKLAVLLTLCFFSSYTKGECETCCSKSSSGNSKPSIDYVQLSVQNTKGFCMLHNCNAPFEGWTIHGLWPSQRGVMGPNGCNGTSSFDPSKLNDLKDKMNKEWPTLFGGDSSGFWQHEWCKHGTCAVNAPSIASISSMESYFSTTLNLFESLNIDNALSNGGVTHSSDTQYQLSKFYIFKTKPAFECVSHSDGQVLFQARFCFTTDLQPADCNMDWFASVKSCDDTLPVYYL